MQMLERLGLFAVCVVAVILAIPTYRTISDWDKLLKDENARMVESHNHVNSAMDLIGSGVAGAGLSVYETGKALSDPETGALPRLTNIAGGIGYSLVSPEGSIHEHINNIDTYSKVIAAGLYSASGAVQDVAERASQIESQTSDAFPAWSDGLLGTLDGSRMALNAWQRTGDVASEHLPLLLKDVDKTVRIAGFIGKDVHTWTYRVTKPQSIPSKMWSLTTDLGRACLRFC